MPSPALRLVPLALAATMAAVLLAGDVGAAVGKPVTAEVVVTLKAPPLAAFGRSLQSASHHGYLVQLRAAQDELADRVTHAVPGSRVRWRYPLVDNGFAVVLPRKEVAPLASVPGVAKVWPNVRYHALAVKGSPQQIGADKLWGREARNRRAPGSRSGSSTTASTPTHPYLIPQGLQYPPGFPKGQTKYTTPKVIVQRAFAPAGATNKYANAPFDPNNSWHATHVAGIAAGRPRYERRGAR